MKLSWTRYFTGRYETWRILLAGLILILLRSPKLLFTGRVFAEEGTVYLQEAWNEPFRRSFLAAHQGYYSLLDNAVAALAANVFPLSWAAVVFTTCAALMLLLLVYIAVTCELFESTTSRLLAAAICLISPSLEVWMTLEDAQFCLGAATAIILLSDSGRHRLARVGTLLLAGLTGPVSCAFMPFFWWKAARMRSAMNVLQAALLTVCTGLQMVPLTHAIGHGDRAFNLFSRLKWLGPVFDTKIVCPTLFTRLGFFLLLKVLLVHQTAIILVLCWTLAFAGLAVFAWIANRGGVAGWSLFGLALWSFAFAYPGVAEPPLVELGGANRYFFIADLLIWLSILLAWQHTERSDAEGKRNAAARRWTRGLLALILLAGVLDSAGYWDKLQWIAAPWAPQVASWERDPRTPITVSPSTWPKKLLLRRHD